MCIRDSSTSNKIQALHLGLALPKVALDNGIYRKMIELCKKLKYFNAYDNLIRCLDDSADPIQIRLLEKESKDDICTRNSLIFERLTLNHVATQVREEIVVSNSEKTSAPFVLPAISWKHRGLIKGMVSRELRMKYHKSILGWIWAMMEPLSLTLTFLLIYEIMATDPAPYFRLSQIHI